MPESNDDPIEPWKFDLAESFLDGEPSNSAKVAKDEVSRRDSVASRPLNGAIGRPITVPKILATVSDDSKVFNPPIAQGFSRFSKIRVEDDPDLPIESYILAVRNASCAEDIIANIRYIRSRRWTRAEYRRIPRSHLWKLWESWEEEDRWHRHYGRYQF